MFRATVNWLYRTGVKRGTTGGHWAWLIVALAAWILRRDSDRISKAPIQMDVKPGDRLMVTMRNLDTTADS